MKKRILPIFLLMLPFLYLMAFDLGTTGEKDSNKMMLFFAIIWTVLFIIFLISNIIFLVFSVFHGVKSEFFLYWNMLLKLLYIPIYLLVFFMGVFTVLLPGAIILTPFLITFDYMLLILTSIYGISGLIQARREKKITTTSALVLGIFHFSFCLDVICAIVAFCMVKSKNSKFNNLFH